MAEFVGVALLMVIVTIAFFVMSIMSTNIYMRVTSIMLTLLLILGDLFIGRVIIEDIAPSATGFINIMDNFYLIGLRFFLFVAFFFMLWAFIRILKYFKNIPQKKRDQKQQEYIMGYKL